MKQKQINSVIKFLVITSVFVVVLASLPVVLYLKVLPWAVSNQKVINYVENVVQKAYSVNIDIQKPYVKTGLTPDVQFGFDNFRIYTAENPEVLAINNFDLDLSLKEIFKKKNIIINSVKLDNISVDVNKVLALPIFNPEKPQEQKQDFSVDIFNSDLTVKNINILYDIDKNTKLKLNAQNFGIDRGKDEKKISYNLNMDIFKGKNNINIKTKDDDKIFIKNNEKILINNSKIYVSQNKNVPSVVNVRGYLDNKYNYAVNLNADNFKIPEVINLLNSQLVENNLSEQLVYFKDITGDFDFNINAANKGINGEVKLNSLGFKLIPLLDLPVLLTDGDIKFDDNRITLTNFKGYYNNNSSNKMDFEGSVKDYLKSVDTNLVGNTIITDDFAKNYLSKMINYPIRIKGEANTRVILKTINNKIDLTWLNMFKKGSGFIIDGEESFMNSEANRVLAAKLHFEDMLLNIKSIDYSAKKDFEDKTHKPVKILSLNGNIDFSDGKTFVKDIGFSLPNPMPSGFINMLIKQKLFKNGNFSGEMRIVNTGKYPVLSGSMKAEKVAIPSQRLFIKNGEFRAKDNLIKITSDGRYRRSKYNLDGSIVNEIKFPIIVKDISLDINNVDVERYLAMFNAQQPTQVSENISTEISKSIEAGGDDEDADDDVQTFDLANLIVEKGVLNVEKGKYKGINFSDLQATMTLNKDSFLQIISNKFNIAEGISTAKIDCDLRNHKYAVRLGIKEVNSDIMATNLLNLSKEIQGKASGLIELNTDDSLKLNGRIQFKVDKGTIGKVGLIEYVMKVASIFRNPVTMISPSIISDLITIPEGNFDVINGDLKIKNNEVYPLMIKTSSPQLSSYIIGTYNLEKQDAALRIYTKFSNRKKGAMGLLRNISLNALSNRMQLGRSNDLNYYSAEVSQLPEIEADEKDCQIFLTKVDGDLEHNNFISSLKKLK